ncbi:hypothetical protein ACWCQK_02450 [Streptomyces sp. NPDC002306]
MRRVRYASTGGPLVVKPRGTARVAGTARATTRTDLIRPLGAGELPG